MRRLTKWVALAMLLSACGGNRLDVDVSGIQVSPVKITRFDKAVFGSDTSNVDARRKSLEQEYKGFYVGYTERIICPGSFDQPICGQQFRAFISDGGMRDAYNACQKKYADLTHLEKGLEDCFRHFKFHFPTRKVPAKVHAMMSGFNYNFIQVEGEYAIGLEMYLGEKSEFYDALQWPLYKRQKLDEPYILPDFAKAWMTNEFPLVDEKGDLLTRMIYEGKIMYLTEALLPDLPDTIRLGYSAKQLEWAKKGEADVWAYFIEKKMLYDTDPANILQLVNDGPFTSGFDHASPPRLGSWIGLQIVKAYLDKNKDITLEALMRNTDAQDILNKSKYKPKF